MYFKLFMVTLPVRAQELCESGGGCPGLPVPNSPYGLCGREATVKLNAQARAQELCEFRSRWMSWVPFP